LLYPKKKEPDPQVIAFYEEYFAWKESVRTLPLQEGEFYRHRATPDIILQADQNAGDSRLWQGYEVYRQGKWVEL
jgi:hypothetical protein